MKLVKKIVPVMLSLALCAGMITPALAHTVTIDGVDGSQDVGTVQEGVVKIAGSESGSGTIELNTEGVEKNAYTDNGDGTYTFEENVVIKDGVDVTLDLNGNTLVHDSDANPKDTDNPVKATVTVEEGSKLTVEDSSAEDDSDTEGATGTGTIDAVTDDISAILNEGDVTLNGGTFTRSKEDGRANNVGGNSYYTIVNHGDMEINSGVTVYNGGLYSSTIDNGWNDKRKDLDDTEESIKEHKKANLTINGGKISYGSAAVKNDAFGVLTIKGGTITGGCVAVQNYSEATILGGNFSQFRSYVDKYPVIQNGDATVSYQPDYSYPSPGVLVINGGNVGKTGWVQNLGHAKLTVHGGTFTDKQTDSKFEEESAKYLADDVTYIVVDVPDGAEEFTRQVGVLSGDKVSASLNPGGTAQFELLLNGKEINGDVQDVTWSVDDEAVVTVDENGKVTAVSAGTATVTATVTGNTVKFTVTVTSAPAPGGDSGDVIIDDADIPLGEGPEEIEIDEEDIPLASGPVTRAQFVDYLWQHEGRPEAEATTFVDVPEDHEYYDAVCWAEANGIAVGLDDAVNFAPDALVSVGQVRLFLARYAQFKGMDMPELTTLTGADSAPVLNCDEVVAEFFGGEPSAEEDAA